MRLLSPRAIALTVFASCGHESATATMLQGIANPDTGWTVAQPLIGRALPCEGGKIRIFECQNVELLSYLPMDSIGGGSGGDLWGWHDSTTGREFLIIGGYSRATTAFVEVTDPINPKYLGVLPPRVEGRQNTTQSVKVYKHYALIGYEFNNGVQIFDLTQLRDVKNPPKVFQETAHYDKITNTHTIAVNQETGFAYANGASACGGGMHMIDVRTPTQPTFAGCYTESRATGASGVGYVHDAQCVVYRGPDQQYKGREICVTAHGDVIGVVDVTDKRQPKTISLISYPNVGFAHQGWFTEDQRRFFLDDEFDEVGGMKGAVSGRKISPIRTMVFDMDDLGDPVVLTEYFAPVTGVDHNLYIRGRYMYQGNNGRGLRIIDIVDPKNPKEVGYLTKVGLAWGTYPYFKNEVVAVSTGTGLFLARLKKD